MNLTTSDRQATLLRIDSENLDAAYAGSFESALQTALKGGSVILDLEQVRFADSIGIGQLVGAARRWGDAIRMTNVGPFLRRCLQRARFATLPAEVRVPEMAATSQPWLLQFPASPLSDVDTPPSPETDRQEFGT